LLVYQLTLIGQFTYSPIDQLNLAYQSADLFIM